jgi:DNA-binding PadR family transcriptional regulator
MKREPLPRNLTLSIPRGFMELHILRILGKPHYGYEIMKRIADECIYWKPSPGSVYPMLQKLKASGFITEKTKGKRKMYILTKEGEERIKRFEMRKHEMRQKMAAMFRMMGADHGRELWKGLDVFDKIRKDPEKLKRAMRLKEDFQRRLKALAEE